MNRLLICGASVRSLAQSAVRAGWVPWCIDFFADADLLTLLEQSGGCMVGTIDSFRDLPRLVAQVPAEIPLLWGGGLENEPELLEQLSRHRMVLGCSVEAVRKSRDLQALHKLLSQSTGSESVVRVPATCWPGSELPGCRVSLFISHPLISRASSASQASGQRWLWKPCHSAGGVAIEEINANDAAYDRINGYLQQYVPGIPISAAFIVTESGVELAGCSLQLTGWPSLNASGFQFCGNFGPVGLPETILQPLHVAAVSIAATMGLTGVFGMDFILSHGQLWFLELNPRVTASHEIYELTKGCNLVAAQGHCRRPSTLGADRHHGVPELSGFCRLLRMVVYQSGNHPESFPKFADDKSASLERSDVSLWLADLPAGPASEIASVGAADLSGKIMSPVSQTASLSAAAAHCIPIGTPLMSIYIGIQRCGQPSQQMLSDEMAVETNRQSPWSAGVDNDSGVIVDHLTRQAADSVADFLRSSSLQARNLDALGIRAAAVAASLEDLTSGFLYHCGRVQRASR